MLLRNVGDPLYVVHSASSTPKTENNDTDISDNIRPTSASKEHQILLLLECLLLT